MKSFYYTSFGNHPGFGEYIPFTGTEEEFLNLKEFRTKIWLYKDMFHRIDGPAILHSTGGMEFYVNDRELYFDEFFPIDAKYFVWKWENK